MDGAAIVEFHHTEVTRQRLDPNPVPETPIVRLYFFTDGIADGCLARVALDVRTLDQEIVPKIFRDGQL